MKEDYPWVLPCVRSVSAKKRKEKLLLFHSNVSKLNLTAKRILKFPFPNESLVEEDKLVEGEVSPSATSFEVVKCAENEVSPGAASNVESLEEEASSVSPLEAVEATNGVDGFCFAKQNMGGSDEELDVVDTSFFRSTNDSCELAKKKRSQSELDRHTKQISAILDETKGKDLEFSNQGDGIIDGSSVIDAGSMSPLNGSVIVPFQLGEALLETCQTDPLNLEDKQDVDAGINGRPPFISFISAIDSLNTANEGESLPSDPFHGLVTEPEVFMECDSHAHISNGPKARVDTGLGAPYAPSIDLGIDNVSTHKVANPTVIPSDLLLMNIMQEQLGPTAINVIQKKEAHAVPFRLHTQGTTKDQISLSTVTPNMEIPCAVITDFSGPCTTATYPSPEILGKGKTKGPVDKIANDIKVVGKVVSFEGCSHVDPGGPLTQANTQGPECAAREAFCPPNGSLIVNATCSSFELPNVNQIKRVDENKDRFGQLSGVGPVACTNPAHPNYHVLAATQNKATIYDVNSATNASCLCHTNGQIENELCIVKPKNLDTATIYHMEVTQGQVHSVPDGAQRKSWAGLFKTEGQNGSLAQTELGSKLEIDYSTTVCHNDFKLEFVDHGGIEDNLVLKIPKDLTEAGKDDWTATLVGRFLGRKLPFSLVTNVTDRLWANEGLIDTLATDSGCFFFSFSSTEARDAILEGGPWFVAGQPLLLRPWKPHFSFENEEVHSVPIWVNFYGIPLEYWNPKGISFISSFIGKPIRVDRITASRRRITYARVCIEVSADFEFFNEFHIEAEDEETGKTIRTKINLEYQWTPVRCKKCSQFGHDCSRTVSPGLSRLDRHPLRRDGKDKGTWQVVSGKDRGKKTTADHTSDRTKSMNGSETPLAKGNRFEALSQPLEDPDPNPAKVDTIVSPSARTSCPEASSSYHTDVPRGETREETTPPFRVDDIDECDSEFGQDSEVGTPTRGSPLSNRQKKKEAKMKFSGSRPKGRQRS